MEAVKEYTEINFYYLYTIVVKRWKLIIAIFFFFISSTAVISLLMPKIYRGEVFLTIMNDEDKSEIINGKQVTELRVMFPANEIIDVLGKLNQENRMSIFPKTHSSVTNLTLKAVKQSSNRIFAVIDSRTRDDIPLSFSELVAYVNNIDTVKSAILERKEKMMKKSSELFVIINSSSRLSDMFHKQLYEGRLVSIGFNPVELDKKISDFKIEKLMVDQVLKKLNAGALTLANQPHIYGKPVKPKIILNLIIAGLTSVFIGSIFIFGIEYGITWKNSQTQGRPNHS